MKRSSEFLVYGFNSFGNSASRSSSRNSVRRWSEPSLRRTYDLAGYLKPSASFQSSKSIWVGPPVDASQTLVPFFEVDVDVLLLIAGQADADDRLPADR